MQKSQLTPADIFEKNQLLTVEKAKSLKGKLIATTSPEYSANTPYIKTFVVGNIISDWDHAATRPYYNDNFANYQDYWASYMKEHQIAETKDRLLLMDSDGYEQCVACVKMYNFFQEPTFHGSDADRPVFYVEI